jgi:hypothetical protein
MAGRAVFGIKVLAEGDLLARYGLAQESQAIG